MVSRENLNAITPERLQAGREYVHALERLGFSVEAAFWTVPDDDASSPHPELALLTSLFEKIGPQRIYKVLFEAHKLALTPEDFDPWVVALYSAETILYNSFKTNQVPILQRKKSFYHPSGLPNSIPRVLGISVEGRFVDERWIYRGTERSSFSPVSKMSQLRKWRRLEERVGMAA